MTMTMTMTNNIVVKLINKEKQEGESGSGSHTDCKGRVYPTSYEKTIHTFSVEFDGRKTTVDVNFEEDSEDLDFAWDNEISGKEYKTGFGWWAEIESPREWKEAVFSLMKEAIN